MKTLYLILIFLHAAIHTLGFVKAFSLKDIKALSQPISKPMGLLWLACTMLFLAYLILRLIHSNYAMLIGGLAVVVSQFLVIYFWSDAKYATLLNGLILMVLTINFSAFQFERTIDQEISVILEQSTDQVPSSINPEDLLKLPLCVQNWMVQSGATKQPRTRNGFLQQKAKMKLKPEQDNWYVADAKQISEIDQPAFVWTVDLAMNPLMGIKGRDKFVEGKGEMLIKMNALFNVVDATGAKIDEGSLQRFLGELVWFPSLALSEYVTWESITENSAKATMKYEGTEGSGIFHFNNRGDFTKFVARRYRGNEPDAARKDWVLTVDEYATFEGIRVPSKMKATWVLDSGDWTWLELEILAIDYNISPAFEWP